MRKIYISFILVIVFLSSFQLKANNPYADSLRNRMAESTGIDYLNSIIYLFDHYMFTNADSALRYVDLCQKYFEEAENIKHQCVFMTSRAEVYYNLRLWDSLVVYAPKVIPYFIENEHYDGVFNVYYMWTDVLLSQDKEEEALEQTQNMYEAALKQDDCKYLTISCLALTNLYYQTKHPNEASYFIDEGFKYLNACLAQDYSINEMLIFINYGKQLVSISSNIGDDLKTLEQANMIIDFIKEVLSKNDKNGAGLELNLFVFFDEFYIDLLSIKAIVYNRLGENDKAKACIDEAESYMKKDRIGGAFSYYFEACKNYYISIKDYEQALYYLDQSLERTLDETDLRSYNNIILMKADLLLKAGKYQESAELFSETIKVQDSISSVEFAEQLSDLRIKYETSKKEQRILEQTSELQKMNFKWIMSLVIILALLMVLMLIWFYNRKIRRKNLSLMRQMDKISTQNDELLALRQAVVKETEVSKEVSLFARLEKLMKEEQIYLNHDISREEVSKKLYTNDLYLRDAIKKETGLSFGSYINMLRLEYSCIALADKNNAKSSVSEIAFNSGFGSFRSYSRLFKDYYGMTPGEYRKSVE